MLVARVYLLVTDKKVIIGWSIIFLLHLQNIILLPVNWGFFYVSSIFSTAHQFGEGISIFEKYDNEW